MDRQIVYPAQIPLETDLLNTNRNTLLAIGKLAGAILGTGNLVNGMAVSPTAPASMSVLVAPGEIYSLQNLDNTDYSSLLADVSHTVMKQGLVLDTTSLACPAPPTAGFSINYLIEVTYLDNDTGLVVLPYYNASNPTQAFSGPNNSGASQATTRAGVASLQAKAGIAAATGSQTTPAADPGYVALAVITVTNGQTTITAANITTLVSSQILSSSLLATVGANAPGRLLNIQSFVASGTYTRTPGANRLRVRCWAGGGGGSGGSSTTQGAGGGGGGYSEAWIAAVPTSTVTIGAGGTAGITGGGNAGNGGSTFLTSPLGTLLVAATGGVGGTWFSSSQGTPGGGGTAGTSGYLTVNGSSGRGQFSLTAGPGQGGSAYGASGGNPHFAAGDPGLTPGGGGAGGGSAGAPGGVTSAGGSGGPGQIIIEEYS